jgi:site-specific DNA-cytosine methylase
MAQSSQDIISSYFKVNPIEINSSLVSAQSRRRLYWTNIPFDLPKDKKIMYKDIKEDNVEDKYYYSDKMLQWIEKHSKRKNKKLKIQQDNEKVQMIEASHGKGCSSQRFFGIEDTKGLRYITPLECERAQTVPDNYTTGVSKTQRYKMLGNGWTIDIISNIIKNII